MFPTFQVKSRSLVLTFFTMYEGTVGLEITPYRNGKPDHTVSDEIYAYIPKDGMPLNPVPTRKNARARIWNKAGSGFKCDEIERAWDVAFQDFLHLHPYQANGLAAAFEKAERREI